MPFEIETLGLMQQINKSSTISAFYTPEILCEIQTSSMLALKGNKNAINYVKKLLI